MANRSTPTTASPTSLPSRSERAAILVAPNRSHQPVSKLPNVKAFSADSAESPLAAASIPRREVGTSDVEFEILFCGVCHSDLHAARNEWAVWPTIYPCVPGHEIVGKVTKVGPKITKFKVGDPTTLHASHARHAFQQAQPAAKATVVPVNSTVRIQQATREESHQGSIESPSLCFRIKRTVELKAKIAFRANRSK
jgi:Alcohol dehydrogenase GroES-like domain